jgi:DNA-binding transcriptional regulator GbsR (MarR family)
MALTGRLYAQILLQLRELTLDEVRERCAKYAKTGEAG